MFENFIFGVGSAGLSIKYIILSFLYNPVVLGFAIGFAASTGVHAIVISDNPRYIPAMLTKKPSDTFHKFAPRDKEGTYQITYTSFLREYNRIRTLFYSAAIVFLIVIAIVLLRF